MSRPRTSISLSVLCLLAAGLGACGDYHPEWHHNGDATNTGTMIGGLDSGGPVVKGLSSPSVGAVTQGIGGTR